MDVVVETALPGAFATRAMIMRTGSALICMFNESLSDCEQAEIIQSASSEARATVIIFLADGDKLVVE